MRNVPWQGEMDPGTTPLNPADFVAVTRYTQDMSLLNSKILNVGEVAEFACNRITDINKTLTEVSGSVEELTADSADYSEKIAAMLTTLANQAAAITQINSALTTVDDDMAAISRSVTSNTDVLNTMTVSVSTLRETVQSMLTTEQTLAERISSANTNISRNDTAIRNLNTTVSALSNTANTLEERVSALESAVNNIIAMHTEDMLEVNAKIAAAETSVNAVTATANKNKSDITAANSKISALESSVNALNSNIESAETEITANKARIGSVEVSVTQISSRQNTDKAELQSRINTVSAKADAVTAEFNEYETATSEALQAASAAVSDISAQVTALRATQSSDKAALQNSIASINSNVTSLSNELSVYKQQNSQQMTSMQASVLATNDNIGLVRAGLTSLESSYNSWKGETNENITEINRKIDEIMGYEAVEIKSFKATPNICESGGSENVVLSWEITGSVSSIKINGQTVTGNSVTMPNVRTDTEYTLTVNPTIGTAVSKTVNVHFVNHIYWGTTKSDTMSQSVVKGLANTVMSDDIVRDVTLTLNDEYAVYAYPKRLGTVQFEVSGFTGGFEAPVTIKVDNHSEYQEDYYVYRSTRKLTGTAVFKIKV